MERITLAAEGWPAQQAFLATSFLERWRGTKPLPEGASLLLRTSSVHGFGLRDPLLLVAIDERMEVSAVEKLEPGAIAWFWRARFIIEMPVSTRPPTLGARLEVAHA